MKGRKIKQVLWGLIPVGGGGHKKRVKEGKYGGNSMYSCLKIEK
jgi:hypothetical protein